MASLTNFTMYYEAIGDDNNLPATFWADAAGKAISQIRFFEDAQYTVECSRYITHFDATAKILRAYVRVSSITDASDKPFYIAIRNTSIPNDKNAFVKTDDIEFIYSDFTDGNTSSGLKYISNILTGSATANGLGTLSSTRKGAIDLQFNSTYNAYFVPTGYLNAPTTTAHISFNLWRAATSPVNNFRIYYTLSDNSTIQVYAFVNPANNNLYVGLSNVVDELYNTGVVIDNYDNHLLSLVTNPTDTQMYVYFDGFEIFSFLLNALYVTKIGQLKIGYNSVGAQQLYFTLSSFMLKGESSTADDVLAYWNNIISKMTIQQFDNKVV